MRKIILTSAGLLISAMAMFGQEVPKLNVTERDMDMVVFRCAGDNETVVEVKSIVPLSFESTMDKAISSCSTREENGFYFYELLFKTGTEYKGRKLKIKSYGFDTYTQPLDLKSKVPVGLLIMREADALYNAGNFSEALKEYEKLYSINPKDEYVERRIKSCNEKITSGSRTIVQELTKELKANVITPQSNSNPASISQNFDEIEFIFVKELGIYIGKYEVTQAQWQSVMGTNPFHNKSPNNPVESISSGYILNFIKKLNNRTGRKYRLPTEAEWVYAAGSKSFKYAGSNYLNEVAWYEQNSDKHTHTVGTKNPNAIGLYDMTGNVCELCRDGELKYKLLGGSFKDNAQDCQLQVGDNGTIRENMSAYEYAGFRLVLEN